MRSHRQSLNVRGHKRLRKRGGNNPNPYKKAPLARNSDGEQRVSKIMAHRGLCSRREAERLIDEGQVELNGTIIRQQGVKASWDAKIVILDRGQNWLHQKHTIVFNKPRGVLSAQYDDEEGTESWQLLRAENGDAAPEILKTVLDKPWSFHVAGRLDKDSRGLLIMTQNGRLVKALTQGAKVEKEYQVVVSRNVTAQDMEKLHQPIFFDNQPCLPMRIDKTGSKTLRFIIKEGRKHQIRLVCKAVGLRVNDLRRVRIGPWRIDDLAEGSWRALSADSVQRLIQQ